VNPALRQMLLLGADCVGKVPFDVIQNEELKNLIEGATTSTQAAEIELFGIKPRRLLVRVVPLAGEPGGVLAVFVDVTDIRRLESMRKDFVANASHELRTPVTAVRSAAETLRFAMESDPESASHFLDIIERNAERLQRLVEDLLDLSRIESREFRLAFEDEELGSLVGQVVGLFRERAEKKQIRLTADVPAGTPLAHVDARAFEQVLTNLVDNALKYSPERASVVVRVREEERRDRKLLRVSVIDTGPGIEERHLPRLFERFYRVDTGRSRELGGTGLGLSIVKHLCDALGGSIGVESTVGKGSTFSFTLGQARTVDTPAPPVSH
jgi:two-component system phosphate regulon sensor histidine kinase PhoR